MADDRDIEVLVLEDQALVRAGMRALIEISAPAAAVPRPIPIMHSRSVL